MERYTVFEIQVSVLKIFRKTLGVVSPHLANTTLSQSAMGIFSVPVSHQTKTVDKLRPLQNFRRNPFSQVTPWGRDNVSPTPHGCTYHEWLHQPPVEATTTVQTPTTAHAITYPRSRTGTLTPSRYRRSLPRVQRDSQYVKRGDDEESPAYC